MTICQVNFRSVHVSGGPSCHLMLWRSLYFSVSPSLLTSPLAIVGISRERVRTGLRVLIVAHGVRKDEHRDVERHGVRRELRDERLRILTLADAKDARLRPWMPAAGAFVAAADSSCSRRGSSRRSVRPRCRVTSSGSDGAPFRRVRRACCSDRCRSRGKTRHTRSARSRTA